MRIRFQAIIKRDDESQLQSIYIPSLRYSKDFKSAKEIEIVRWMGLQHFIENQIYQTIAQKKANREKFEDESTRALMTQGFSELSKPTFTYDIYLVKKIQDINLANIEGNGIILEGNGRKRKAYIVTDQSFHQKNNQKWFYVINLSKEQNSILKKIGFNSKFPVIFDTIEICYILRKLEREIIEAAGRIYLGPNSHTMDVFIHDRDRRACNFFATVLPPFTRINQIVQIGLSTLLDLGLMDAMSNPLFPPQEILVRNSTTGNVTDIIMRQNPYLRPFNIIQEIIGCGMWLLFTFAGPRQRSVKGLGVQVDDFFIGIYNKFCGNSPQPESKKIPKKECTSLDCKVNTSKAIFFLLVLNQVFLMALMSYLRIKMLQDKISENDDSLLPQELIKDVSWAQWIISQFQDPMYIVSEANMLFYIVESYFRPNDILGEINHLHDQEKKEEKPTSPAQIRKALLASPPRSPQASEVSSPESDKDKETSSRSHYIHFSPAVSEDRSPNSAEEFSPSLSPIRKSGSF